VFALTPDGLDVARAVGWSGSGKVSAMHRTRPQFVATSASFLGCLMLGASWFFEAEAAAVRVRVSQESAPGAGDFDANVLGELDPFDASQGSAAFYSYSVPAPNSFNNAAIALVTDRAHLAILDVGPSAALCVVFDSTTPDVTNVGRAETRLQLTTGTSTFALDVLDDPEATSADRYVLAPTFDSLSCTHVWNPCCTDGFVVSGLLCGASVTFTFTDVDDDATTPTILNLTSFAAYSSTGGVIELALAVDRRVRLEVLPSPGCIADLSCDGNVDASDLSVVLSAWGSLAGVSDLDGDGVVGSTDLGILLGEWGPCVPPTVAGAN